MTQKTSWRSLGCTLERSQLDLSKHQGELDYLDLKHRIERSLTYVDLTSEAARREVLVAPILLELCNYTQSKLKIEYPIAISDQLKGTLDYYIQSERGFLVVEAKNADLSRGFTQLAVELIALDRWTTSDASFAEFTTEIQRYFTDGDTYEEALSNAQEVLELLIESYQAEGKPLPQPQILQVA